MQDIPGFDPICWVEDVPGAVGDLMGRRGNVMERREEVVKKGACPDGEAVD